LNQNGKNYKVMKNIFNSLLALTSVLWFVPSDAFSEMNAQSALAKPDNQFFIENKGQWPEDVLYLCRMGGLDTWITKYGVNYTFYQLEKDQSASESNSPIDHDFETKNYRVIGHRILKKLQNHNANPDSEGKFKSDGYHNYLVGNDPNKHVSNVGLYKEVILKEVYSGIDLRYYFDKGSLRHDYIVHPGADATQIMFSIEGSDNTLVDEKGNLVFTTRFGEVAMAELLTYQASDKKEIKSAFVQTHENWTISIADYDRSRELIIDPLLYSTFIGGIGHEIGRSIAVDGSGNAYITGSAEAGSYDITPGAFQTDYGGGNRDAFVTKLNQSGTSLLYSTYIGGSASEYGRSVFVDNMGNAYITGETRSGNFPVTEGAFQSEIIGLEDVFVLKLNADGSGLMYSTYIGGEKVDVGRSIDVDASGNAYITGETYSTSYPISEGAFQTAKTGLFDAFVTKLNATGTALLYSTYIGGIFDDYGRSVAVDSLGNAYITGETNSSDYPVTTGAFQTSRAGLEDAFVTKLNALGTELVYSTFVGGGNTDSGRSISVDVEGCAYITGYTESNYYPVTPGAYQTSKAANEDIIVTKLNATGTNLIYSTYLGGSGDDSASSIAIDSDGNASITGVTRSTNYPITSDAFQTNFGGGYFDAFVTRINTTGTNLNYSTFLGGSNTEYGISIAVDFEGSAFVTGGTLSLDFPVSTDGFQTVHAGNNDVYVTKVEMAVNVGITEKQLAPDIIVYPNPSSGTVFIELIEEEVHLHNYEIVNIAGKTLHQGRLTGRQTMLDMSGYSNGAYLLKIYVDESQAVSVIKLLKN